MSESSSDAPRGAKVIDLRDFIPTDIIFILPGDEEYAIPGDVDNKTAWELYGLLLDAAKIPDVMIDEPGARRTLEAVQKIDARMQEILLGLFQQRHPDLTAVPGGAKASRVYAHTLLTTIGFLSDSDDEADADPTAGSPKTSGSSTTGSTPSSRSSGSPRPRGKR